MKQIISFLLLSTVILGCPLSKCVHSAVIRKETAFFTFENSSDVIRWKSSSLASIQLSSDWSETGNYSAYVVFHAWDSSKETKLPSDDGRDKEMLEPAPTPKASTGSVSAKIPSSALDGQKLSAFDFLEFTIHNPSNKAVQINVMLTGKRRARETHISLEANETQRIKIGLRQNPYLENSPLTDQIDRYLSAEDADGISFNLPYPSREVGVYIDNFSLIIDPESELTKLASIPYAPVEKIRHLIKEIQQEIGNADWEQIQSWRLSISKVKKETNTLRLRWNEIQAQNRAGNADFVLLTKNPTDKIFLEKERFKSTFKEPAVRHMFAARNEAESFQTVIYPVKQKLKNVSWDIEPFRNKAGEAIPVSVRMVGYVQTEHQPRYHVPFLGWWPDILIDNVHQRSEIPKDEVQPLWITVEVPKNARAGAYSSQISVTANDQTLRLPIKLRVWDFVLPTKSGITTVVQFTRLSAMSQFAPPKRPEATYKKRYDHTTTAYENWLLKYRIQPGNIYGGSPPEWSVRRIHDLRKRGLSAISLGYIRIQRKEADSYDPKKYWQHVENRIENIEKRIPVLKKAGVWDDPNTLLYINLFDEFPGTHMGIVYETAEILKKKFPNVKLITTAYDLSYGIGRSKGDLIDIWVPHANIVSANSMHINRAKQEGRKFWWYFAVGSYKPYMNIWLESPGVDSRIIGSISYQYDMPGFMYWDVNRWFKNRPGDIGQSPRTQWNAQSFGSGEKNAAHGDGSIFYARYADDKSMGSVPLASIRLENYRDGAEDYEYYALLERLRKQKGVLPTRVDIPKDVLKNTAEYSDDYNVYESQRHKIAQEILNLIN